MTEATNATRPTRNAQIAGILRFALRKMYGGATTVVTRGDDGEWRTLYTYEDVASLLNEFEQAAAAEREVDPAVAVDGGRVSPATSAVPSKPETTSKEPA